VRAYDAGHDGNVYYLVTEYIPGTDLRRLVRAEGPLGMRQAASIIRQSSIALQYAHDKGLIHRDVKPGNILVTPEGEAKVSDLGLAGFLRCQDDPRAKKTVGTPDYVSPELIRAPETVTTASDIYSLGCTLYYAVTGKVPYPGGTTREKARSHLENTPMHPRRFNPNVSEEFVDIIADMMAKDPRERVQLASEVAARLEPWAGELSPIAPPRIGSPWLPPPVPNPANNDLDAMQATDDATMIDDPQRSGSQFGRRRSAESDSTHPVASGSQDTAKPGNLPALPVAEGHPHSAVGPVVVALAIAIPVSMLLGALIAVAFALLLR
jgi:serine/threonine protein kinase